MTDTKWIIKKWLKHKMFRHASSDKNDASLLCNLYVEFMLNFLMMHASLREDNLVPQKLPLGPKNSNICRTHCCTTFPINGREDHLMHSFLFLLPGQHSHSRCCLLDRIYYHAHNSAVIVFLDKIMSGLPWLLLAVKNSFG